MESPPSYALVLTVFAVLFASAQVYSATIALGFDGAPRYTIVPSSIVSFGYTRSETSRISYGDTVGANLQFDVDPGLGLMEIVDEVSVTPVPEATAATVFGADSFAVGLARERNS